jgi:release factor glutamine methyltransferase
VTIPDDDRERVVTRRLRSAGCVFAEDEARLLLAEAGDDEALESMVVDRTAGRPLEQVLGWAAFAGRRIVVEPGVFVPRRRTELVVREASAALVAAGRPGDAWPAPVVALDLCCGAGAVGAVLAAEHADVEVWATDVDPVAVHCARRNLDGHATVVRGDLFGGLPTTLRGRIRVVAANAPYVPTDAIPTMPPEARLHESTVALDGGADGLDLHRRIAVEVGGWLAPGGTLVLETSGRQASDTREALVAAGLEARVVRDDEIDGTVVVAIAPSAAGPGGWRG